MAARFMKRTTLALLLTVLAGVGLAAQIDPRAALLERGAWEALNAGRARAAAEAFREALASDPKNARLHLGAGMAAALERRDQDAKDALERALALDAHLTPARTLLGQIQYRLGDFAGAIRTYETLISLAPDQRDAQATLERWRRELELHDRMQQAIGSHFTVSFEGPAEAALAAQALEVLDRAYWRIGLLLGGAYPNQPVPVVLYTGEQFRDITRSPSWAAGAYDGIIRVPLRALQSGFGRFTGDAAQLAYATSALAARRLIEEAGGFAIANLLRDLGDGVDFDTAFLHRIQRTFSEFQTPLG